MKNEDKIIELLAENLKNQDRQADLVARQGDLVAKQGEKLDLLVDVVKDVNGAIHHLTSSAEAILNKFDQINDH